MKKVLLFSVLAFSLASYAKEVPGPNLWYNLSEKILLQSYQLIGNDKDITSWRNAKQKMVKTKTLEVSSKYQPKKQIILPDYFNTTPEYFPTAVKDNIWLLAK